MKNLLDQNGVIEAIIRRGCYDLQIPDDKVDAIIARLQGRDSPEPESEIKPGQAVMT